MLSSEKESKEDVFNIRNHKVCMNASEMKEYINHTLNDPYYTNYPEDYNVVGKLYDIFTCRDEQYMHTRYHTGVKRLGTTQIRLLMI